MLARLAPFLSVALAAATAGCGSDPHGLDWGFQLATPALRARATVIEARILRGGCAGTALFAAEIPVTGTTSVAMERPGELAAGRYGLAGTARDTGCTIIAEGCDEVDLPADADVRHVVTLSGATERPACEPVRCSNGSCGAVDAGLDAGAGTDAGLDAGLDAGPDFDAGDFDAGTDAGDDAGPGFDAGAVGVDAGPGMDAGSALPDAGRDAGRDASRDAARDGAAAICGAGTADCDLNGSCETNTTNDRSNCGTCGRSCGEASCVSSVCTCTAPLAYDGAGRCRDLVRDPTACSALATTCRADQYCTGSSCVCRPGYETLSGGACANLQNDPHNCGSAGTDCATMGSMVTCRASTCQDSCTAGQMNCSNACVQLDRDPLHCGTCTTACTTGQVCASSTCQSYRPAIGCAACPCATACTGSFSTCCTYGSNTICVSGPTCPSTFP